jgi:hypothetical protein
MNVITMPNARTAKRNYLPTTTVTPGFACKIEEDTDLGSAFLIAEYTGGGGYFPVSTCSTVSEGREIAASWHSGEPRPALTFKIWARGLNGAMALAASFSV